MSNSLKRSFPKKAARITTGCQYCAVGCGYNAFLTPDDGGKDEYDGVSRFITPAMTNTVRYKGEVRQIAVAPDARCDLNKGNHSVRGGSQGENLVTADGTGRSTQDRLKSPMVRLRDGRLHEITWRTLNEILARLLIEATSIKRSGSDDDPTLKVENPDGLGVKLYEYQYLENTYAATKLFYGAIGTRNLAYHDRPSAAGSSPGMKDAGLRPHDFSYDDILDADVIFIIGTNPYENQSVFFMQYCQGKEMIVMDPRLTATAQYGVQTGGLHLRPKWLGADSFVLYAMARSLIEDHGIGKASLDLNIGNPGKLTAAKYDWDKRRRKSRVMNFDTFEDFLVDGDYSLTRAATVSGIPLKDLENAVKRLAKKRDVDERPNVAILYEKGMIWGFNYHNTAAVASLGVLLGSYGRAGRLTGRVGGHQKGWAENAEPVDVFKGSTGRYPFKRGKEWRMDGDRYSDDAIAKQFEDVPEILVKHNLDNHVFGPTEDEHENQSGIGNTEVRLKNGLVTRKDPDVKLLWIIGGNYLGQTNDAARKRARLLDRLKAGKAKIARPSNADADTVVDTLTERMKKGIVLVHQEIFANPTTEFCDIVIPAAGWGEDTFCRYNAQRRLKLYERFQDMPLHKEDVAAISAADSKDPMAHIAAFRHSPKPDWVIFRDIAREIGNRRDPIGRQGPLAEKLAEAFGWENSSILADEMAENSHRKSMLGALIDFGKARGISKQLGRVHTVLGKFDTKGKPGNGDAKYLLGEDNYIVVDETIDDGGKHKRESTNVSAIYGNGVASNGVMLPVHYENGRLEGTLRKVQKPDGSDQPVFFFVKAPWDEIEWAYERANRLDIGGPAGNQVIVTNGRFNHLWNNMFHHLRNDYVNERYSEDMPGTILELNPDWATKEGISNGQVVEVAGPAGSFRAVASLQDGVAEGGAFAMFSYPVRSDGAFTFDGYPNNLTDGYADGINPIAALKYARATVSKVPDPATGKADWIYRSITRQGPTYAQRNRIGPKEAKTAPGKRLGESDRLDWEMRELIVRKGLPRAVIDAHESYRNRFLAPDGFVEFLKGDDGKEILDLIVDLTEPLQPSAMHWPWGAEIIWDEWGQRDHEIAKSLRDGLTYPGTAPGSGDNDGGSASGGTEGEMEDFVKIGSIEDFPVETIHKIAVDGDARALYHLSPDVDGVNAECPIYVTQLHCWHRHPDNQANPNRWCELTGTGVVDGRTVRCDTRYKPACAHRSQFDIITGERLRGPAPANKPLVVYETKCIGDDIWVAIEPADSSGQ